MDCLSGSKMRNQVFVYGTLKKGHYNHRCISMDKTAKLLIDDAFISAKMYDLGAFPAAVAGFSQVKGEVWDVDDETLERLDHLEGHPRHYCRRMMYIIGGSVSAWVYLMDREKLPKNAVPMPVGNWPIKR